MDQVRNPFSPGAGSRPPEIVGREEILQEAEVALRRVIAGRAAQSQILLGLRGTGKTVLLNEIENVAEDTGFITSFIEAPEHQRLVQTLSPLMHQTLRKLSVAEKARTAVRTALSGLRGFASVFKVKIDEFQIGVDPSPGTADSGNLEFDLTEMFELIGRAAAAAGRGWALLIDEVQYLENEELGALIVAQHRINRKGLPVIVVAAGLPQIAKLSGDAKSYAERLFNCPQIGALTPEDAAAAIRTPLVNEGADIQPEALTAIVEKTLGYPFFLQEWGYQAWNEAAESLITSEDVAQASVLALNRMDNGFFKVRLDRLSPSEIEYVDAMAALGAGPYRSIDVANQLGVKASSLGPRRASIISKGMIYSPSYGDIDFTVPLFDDFLRRRVVT